MTNSVGNLTIQEATDDDLLEVAELKALDDSEAIGEEVSVEKALDKVMGFTRRQIWIARLDGEAVGYWVGKKEGDDAYRSDGIFVKGEHRRKGIGRMLKESQADYARGMGFEELYSSTKNPHAEKILKRLGCTYDEPSNTHVLALQQ